MLQCLLLPSLSLQLWWACAHPFAAEELLHLLLLRLLLLPLLLQQWRLQEHLKTPRSRKLPPPLQQLQSQQEQLLPHLLPRPMMPLLASAGGPLMSSWRRGRRC